MGRPARFTTEALIGAATALAAEGGPAAVTMAAVARRLQDVHGLEDPDDTAAALTEREAAHSTSLSL